MSACRLQSSHATSALYGVQPCGPHSAKPWSSALQPHVAHAVSNGIAGHFCGINTHCQPSKLGDAIMYAVYYNSRMRNRNCSALHPLDGLVAPNILQFMFQHTQLNCGQTRTEPRTGQGRNPFRRLANAVADAITALRSGLSDWRRYPPQQIALKIHLYSVCSTLQCRSFLTCDCNCSNAQPLSDPRCLQASSAHEPAGRVQTVIGDMCHLSNAATYFAAGHTWRRRWCSSASCRWALLPS